MLKTNTSLFFLESIALFVLIHLPSLCLSQQTNSTNSSMVTSLRDNNTITSSRNVFQLGFFSPPNNTNRYLAIYYTFSRETVIWIANRDQHINDSSGHLTIASDGNLVLINGWNETVWSTNINRPSLRMNTSAQLLDTGNLVLNDTSTGTILWESFSQPLDFLVANMRMSDNPSTHTRVSISSWKSPSDPGVGNFTSGIGGLQVPQLFIWQDNQPIWRSGPWNGRFFSGVEVMYGPYINGFIAPEGQYIAPTGEFIPQTWQQNGTRYFVVPEGQFFLRNGINSTGTGSFEVWNPQRRAWDPIWLQPQRECDRYGACGPFGICSRLDSRICSCMQGFEPANSEEWNMGNWTGGCVRRSQLQCSQNNNTGGDGFSRLQYMKVPDFYEPIPSLQGDGCMRRCLSNCSCIGYVNDPGIGCMVWSNILIDSQRLGGVGVDFYIRLPASELGNRRESRRLVLIIPTVVGGLAIVSIIIFISWCWIFKRKEFKAKAKRRTFASNSTDTVLKDEMEKDSIEELPLFTFHTLANATNQFGDTNLLGKGGFGLVYKGTLENGKEIAVKRLSTTSCQGDEEFKNEMVVISKLQHRNLVRLSGCCVERDEKMLIYEYMPNKSLDGCLFDPTHPSQKILDWKKRTSIIEGIGRGLLYLHNDSRLKIIHRDLKPSNVLLDNDWNPKISDFGMARIFGGNQEHGSTARVVGTYGYMAPEYATEGRYSEKSDIYSFGVLMLEILSGKKNTHYYNEELSLSLLGFAWKMWDENNGLAFVDQSIASPRATEDILRYLCIALLCVQELPNNRPAIETVLSMLSHEILDLPKPEEPMFAEKWNASQVGTNSLSQLGHSINELTLTVLDGR